LTQQPTSVPAKSDDRSSTQIYAPTYRITAAPQQERPKYRQGWSVMKASSRNATLGGSSNKDHRQHGFFKNRRCIVPKWPNTPQSLDAPCHSTQQGNLAPSSCTGSPRSCLWQSSSFRKRTTCRQPSLSPGTDGRVSGILRKSGLRPRAIPSPLFGLSRATFPPGSFLTL
jgi:hypothetical protein